MRPVRLPKGEPLQLGQPVEGRMLDSFDLWNVHQSPESNSIKNLAVRREHWPQLEGQHVRISPAHCLISCRLLGGRFSVQSARLEQNRNSAMTDNDVHLLPVKFDDVASLPFDVGAAHKWHIFAQRLPG